jgi:hypothetical protein
MKKLAPRLSFVSETRPSPPRADLLKQSPLCFEVREVLFAVIFTAALLDQAVGAPDALQGAMGNGRSNSRIKRRAPKVGSVLRNSTSCASKSGGVF